MRRFSRYHWCVRVFLSFCVLSAFSLFIFFSSRAFSPPALHIVRVCPYISNTSRFRNKCFLILVRMCTVGLYVYRDTPSVRCLLLSGRRFIPTSTVSTLGGADVTSCIVIRFQSTDETRGGDMSHDFASSRAIGVLSLPSHSSCLFGDGREAYARDVKVCVSVPCAEPSWLLVGPPVRLAAEEGVEIEELLSSHGVFLLVIRPRRTNFRRDASVPAAQAVAQSGARRAVLLNPSLPCFW
jgi:hypothetical protein